MRLPDVMHRILANQLGGPSGPVGVLIARRLNRGNLPSIRAAVEALEPGAEDTVADIGFGGGIGLDLLLATVGTVHGIDPAVDMVNRARKSHAADVAAGRLQLHEASMESLPLDAKSLDGWISLNTIYFMDELPKGFAELHRVLKPGAVGVLGIASPEWMRRQPFTKHRFTIRPVDDVVAALEDAGFTVERPPFRHDGQTNDDEPYNLLLCRTATA